MSKVKYKKRGRKEIKYWGLGKLYVHCPPTLDVRPFQSPSKNVNRIVPSLKHSKVLLSTNGIGHRPLYRFVKTFHELVLVVLLLYCVLEESLWTGAK